VDNGMPPPKVLYSRGRAPLLPTPTKAISSSPCSYINIYFLLVVLLSTIATFPVSLAASPHLPALSFTFLSQHLPPIRLHFGVGVKYI
jgi:hypothetical protein